MATSACGMLTRIRAPHRQAVGDGNAPAGSPELGRSLRGAIQGGHCECLLHREGER